MYGMTTLAPSMNLTVDGFCWLSVVGLPCRKNCVG